MRRTVDLIINPLVHLVNVPAKLGGIQIELRPFLRENRVKLRVEYADDFRGLVVDDRVLLLVPQQGHGEAAGIVGVRAEVEVFHVLGLVERVDVGAGERVHGGERPAVRAHAGRDDGECWGIVRTQRWSWGRTPRGRRGEGERKMEGDTHE